MLVSCSARCLICLFVCLYVWLFVISCLIFSLQFPSTFFFGTNQIYNLPHSSIFPIAFYFYFHAFSLSPSLFLPLTLPPQRTTTTPISSYSFLILSSLPSPPLSLTLSNHTSEGKSLFYFVSPHLCYGVREGRWGGEREGEKQG